MSLHTAADDENTKDALLSCNALLSADLASAVALIAQLTEERDRLRAAHERLRQELELLKRRIFVASAERIDTHQLEMEFLHKLKELDALNATLDGDITAARSSEDDPPPDDKAKKKSNPKGRRDLRLLDLPETRIEIKDPVFEAMVEQGTAERAGFSDDKARLGWRRGGHTLIVVALANYKTRDASGNVRLVTATAPPEALPRCMAAPSTLARVATEKLNDGMPLYRLEERTAREGVPLDRGTMCRWLDEMGGTLGATVVFAMRQDAMAHSFCFACDATGIKVQPPRGDEKKRQACKKGHYFVQIADRDHIFFEYQARETSAAVREMFRGFSGYVQVDAKSVFDILFREPRKSDDEADGCERFEVGCWSHGRRKFWEAATAAKDEAAREGLIRISRMFDIDEKWRGLPHSKIKKLRDRHLRPHVEKFFVWATEEYDKVKDERGLLRSALGYVVRQEAALKRFLEDGRLEMTNNRSERTLRRLAVGRKNWLFVGSDEHAENAGALMSLIASARLWKLDPELYLRDVLRVLPYWPRDRYLELAPKYWAKTRTRLDGDELAREFGPLTVPPPETAEQESGAN
jgi:transposase